MVENSLVSHEGEGHSDLDSDIIDIHRINVSKLDYRYQKHNLDLSQY